MNSRVLTPESRTCALQSICPTPRFNKNALPLVRYPPSQVFPVGRHPWHGAQQQRPDLRARSGAPQLDVENPELLGGDAIAISSFCLYKQLAAILSHPHFPGWLTPLHFDPTRFLQLILFTVTLTAAWSGACLVTGGYKTRSTRDVSTTLLHVSRAWLAALPLGAGLLFVVYSSRFLGDGGAASSLLPMGASGPGEPFVSLAQLLGVLTLWRTYYTVALDYWNPDRGERNVSSLETLVMVGVMATTSSVVVSALQVVVSPDMVQQLVDTTLALVHV